MLRRTGYTAVLVAIFALLAFQITPALAHHKENHAQGPRAQEEHAEQNDAGAVSDHDGDADSSSDTAYTEDNDTNDGGTANNVEDGGDNYHPSGKDRSVEHGGSGTQGKSESNPDDSKGPMRYEGVQGDDKPNGPGGTDLADQDGNNGCGNDDDFDDDNNGWCGKPTDNDVDDDGIQGSISEICEDDMAPGETCGDDVNDVLALEEEICADVMSTTDVECDDDDVSDSEICADVMSTTDVECDDDADGDVLGVMLNRGTPDRVLGSSQNGAPATVAAAGVAAAPAGALPFTGGQLIPFAALGMGLIGSGFALVRRNR